VLRLEGLEADRNYTFTVTVRDEDGYETKYNRVRIKTLEESSQSASALDRAMMAFENNDGEISIIMDEKAPLLIGSGGHLLVWLDGSDITGNGDDFEGPVEIWADKSGMGNHAEQPVFDRQPCVIPVYLLNKLSAVRFDSSNQSSMVVRLGAGMDNSALSSAYTVFIAADGENSKDNNTNSFGCYFIGKESSGGYLGLFQEKDFGEARLVIKTSWNNLLNIPAISSPFAASLQFSRINSVNVAFFEVGGDLYLNRSSLKKSKFTGSNNRAHNRFCFRGFRRYGWKQPGCGIHRRQPIRIYSV